MYVVFTLPLSYNADRSDLSDEKAAESLLTSIRSFASDEYEEEENISEGDIQDMTPRALMMGDDLGFAFEHGISQKQMARCAKIADLAVEMGICEDSDSSPALHFWEGKQVLHPDVMQDEAFIMHRTDHPTRGGLGAWIVYDDDEEEDVPTQKEMMLGKE